MFILLARALTLEGAWDGLAYYVRVDWSKLTEGRTWIDGATQVDPGNRVVVIRP